MSMIALFIGRFQPFHLGHQQLITNDISDYEHLYIGIGSSQYHHTYQNPFSYDERKQMIELVFKDKQMTDFSIFPIPDIHDPPNWVNHVVQIIPDFTDVFSNNPVTIQLFKKKGYMVHEPGFYQEKQYCGKEIRNRIQHHQKWNHLVDPIVYSYLCSIKAEERVRSLEK